MFSTNVKQTLLSAVERCVVQSWVFGGELGSLHLEWRLLYVCQTICCDFSCLNQLYWFYPACASSLVYLLYWTMPGKRLFWGVYLVLESFHTRPGAVSAPSLAWGIVVAFLQGTGAWKPALKLALRAELVQSVVVGITLISVWCAVSVGYPNNICCQEIARISFGKM